MRNRLQASIVALVFGPITMGVVIAMMLGVMIFVDSKGLDWLAQYLFWMSLPVSVGAGLWLVYVAVSGLKPGPIWPYLLVAIVSMGAVLWYFAALSLRSPGPPESSQYSHIARLASALELYHYDHRDYPDHLEQLVPAYIDELSTSHEPSRWVGCTKENFQYSYRRVSDSDYRITFCFNQAFGNYRAGIHDMTPQGIQ